MIQIKAGTITLLVPMPGPVVPGSLSTNAAGPRRNPAWLPALLFLAAVPLEAGYLILRRLHNLKLYAVEYIALSLAMSLFYIAACRWVEKSKEGAGAKGRLAYIFLAGMVFRATLLPLYPSLTEDPFRYRWEGKLQSAGGNPYVVRPQDPNWAGLRDGTWGSVNRKDLPTGYGPLLELVYRVTYAVVSRLEPNEFRQVVWFKIPFLIFDLATSGMLALLLRELGLPLERVLIYLWSPLVVVEVWASGHND